MTFLLSDSFQMIRFSLKDRKNATNQIVAFLPRCREFVSDDCDETKRMKRIREKAISEARSLDFLSDIKGATGIARTAHAGFCSTMKREMQT